MKCGVCCQNVWPPLTPAQKIALQQRKRELERGGWMGVCQKLKIPQAAAAIFTAERIWRMRGDKERSCENFWKTKWKSGKENSDGVGVEGTSPPSSFTAHRRLREKKTEDIVNCSCLVTWFVWWTMQTPLTNALKVHYIIVLFVSLRHTWYIGTILVNIRIVCHVFPPLVSLFGLLPVLVKCDY